MAEFIVNINDPEAQAQDFSVIPAGKYVAYLESTEKKQAKSGKDYLQFCFHIVEGQYKGRKLWERFFIYEPEKVASLKFAKQKIGAMCRAVGLDGIRDTAELEGRNFLITVKVDASDRGEQNTIANYAPVPAVNIQAADTSAVPW